MWRAEEMGEGGRRESVCVCEYGRGCGCACEERQRGGRGGRDRLTDRETDREK